MELEELLSQLMVSALKLPTGVHLLVDVPCRRAALNRLSHFEPHANDVFRPPPFGLGG